MTVARAQLVDASVTPWYHVISKTVRGAFLLAEGVGDRKQWIENRLQELCQLFAVEVAGFAVLDNHLHVLVRLEPERAEQWSDAEVVRRWARLFPPRGKDRQLLPVTRSWLQEKQADQAFVKTARTRLAELGWFMKCLKEPLARIANEQDGCQGAFWQGRYKSIAILDEEALLATCAYIDLNPFAARLTKVPEQSQHTSIRTRVDHCRNQGRIDDLQSARDGSVASVKQCRGMETGLWLCPIEDRRNQGRKRAGLLENFSLGSYLQLVDYTSRLVRRGKARLSRDVASLLTRLGTTPDVWEQTLTKMFGRTNPLGVAFAFRRERLRDAATQRGCHHLANLNGCPA